MSWKRKFEGGGLAFIGFLLSPLSWWNDMFVNVPLAVAFGWLVSLPFRPAFEPAVIVGYWLTNVLGFVLLHKGAKRALSHAESPALSPRNWWRDLLISLLYTLLILALMKLKLLQPIAAYFPAR